MGKNSIYKVARALTFSMPDKKPLECLVASIGIALCEIDDKEKINFFEVDAIIDYKIYKKKIENQELDEFVDYAWEVIPFSNNLTHDQKLLYLKQSLLEEEDELLLHNVIARRIQKDYFPLDNFENFLRAFS